MKLKLFIVTYQNSPDLIANLNSLFNSNWQGHHLEINIINNHSNFYLPSNLLNRVKVWHNILRPDFSTGHLSRNWNQAIINGFKSLKNPDCDIVCTCQDDTIFEPDWAFKLIEYHNQFSFIQMGVGDNFCSYLPSAVENIGLWDERFCGIGYQEADYFLRAWLYNRDKSSINDEFHKRILNPLPYKFANKTQQNYMSEHHKKSLNYHPISCKMFIKKWGVNPEEWDSDLFKSSIKHSRIDNYITYPYFELDVKDLAIKKYIF